MRGEGREGRVRQCERGWVKEEGCMEIVQALVL